MKKITLSLSKLVKHVKKGQEPDLGAVSELLCEVAMLHKRTLNQLEQNHYLRTLSHEPIPIHPLLLLPPSRELPPLPMVLRVTICEALEVWVPTKCPGLPWSALHDFVGQTWGRIIDNPYARVWCRREVGELVKMRLVFREDWLDAMENARCRFLEHFQLCTDTTVVPKAPSVKLGVPFTLPPLPSELLPQPRVDTETQKLIDELTLEMSK